MNLKELKQSLFDAEDMTEIYAKIKRWAAEGDEEVNFSQDEISDTQIEKLREDGYTVHWNRPCLWWGVSGWK